MHAYYEKKIKIKTNNDNINNSEYKMCASTDTGVYSTYASVPFAEEPDSESKILPWNANEREINIWLTENGYGSVSIYTCTCMYM